MACGITTAKSGKNGKVRIGTSDLAEITSWRQLFHALRSCKNKGSTVEAKRLNSRKGESLL